MKALNVLLLGAALLAGTPQVRAQGITPNEILIGSVASLTGSSSGPSKEVLAGAGLYIDHVNATGGVNGRKIRLETLDDKRDIKLTAELARVLVEEKKVFALMLVRGTPNVEAMLPLLNRTGTPLIAPSTGANQFHEPMNRLIFNVRTKYQVEAERAVVQLGHQGIKRIAILQVETSFGKDVVAGYEKGFKAASLTPVAVIKFDYQKADIEDVVKKTIAAAPDAIVTAGSAKVVADIVKGLRAKGSQVNVITISNNSAQDFITDLGAAAHGVIVMQVFPDPRKQSTQLAVEMQRLAKNVPDFTLSHAGIEGFAAAKVMVEGLKRAGKTPTRDSFIRGLESLKEYDLGGGLVLSYGPNNRSGLSFVEPSIINKKGAFMQ